MLETEILAMPEDYQKIEISIGGGNSTFVNLHAIENVLDKEGELILQLSDGSKVVVPEEDSQRIRTAYQEFRNALNKPLLDWLTHRQKS